MYRRNEALREHIALAYTPPYKLPSGHGQDVTEFFNRSTKITFEAVTSNRSAPREIPREICVACGFHSAHHRLPTPKGV